MRILAKPIPTLFKVTDQYVWLPDLYDLPATMSCTVTCGKETDEFIPCFSFTRAEGDTNSDALSWYVSPHRNDFTFRTQLFGKAPNITRVASPWKPEVGKKFTVYCEITTNSATYYVNGKKYAVATFSHGDVPIQGYFGFAKYGTNNITVENVQINNTIEMAFVEQFELMWNDKGSGGDHDGAFYRPVPPDGFHSLGDLGQPSYYNPTLNSPTSGCVAVKALVPDALAPPVNFELVWRDSGSGADRDGSFWRPIPPAGYKALGLVAQNGYSRPSLDCMMCVKQEYLVQGELSTLVWNDAGTGANSDFSSWKVVSHNDKALISTMFSGHASHTKPTQCKEAWTLSLDFIDVPESIAILRTDTGTILMPEQSSVHVPEQSLVTITNPVPQSEAIQIESIERFELMWDNKGSGGNRNGAFYRPVPPDGFYSLGDLGQSNYYNPTSGCVAVKALVPDALAPPVNFELVWNDSGSGADRDGSFWRPIPPAGYKALGLVAQNGYSRPSLDCMVCVKQEYLVQGELSSLVWNDAGTGANSDFGSWKVVSNNEKALASTTFSGHASHARPTQCNEAWALNIDFTNIPENLLLQFKQTVTHISFNKGGFPLDYHRIAVYRLQHCQDMIRLPNDAAGNRYYMGTYSQNVEDNEGGMVFVARRDGGNSGAVIWCDELNNRHSAGGYNHPGDLRRLGNIVVIAGQNWDPTAGKSWYDLKSIGTKVGDSFGRGSGGQNILFYNVSNPADPKYMGRLNTFVHNRRWVSLDTDIDNITLNKVDGWYYLAFNGIKGTNGLVCRARTLSPNACWTSVQEGNLGSLSPIKLAGGVMMASKAGSAMQLTPFPYGENPPAQISGTFPRSAFGDGTTFSVSTLAGGKSYIIRTNVESDNTIEIEEIESVV